MSELEAIEDKMRQYPDPIVTAPELAEEFGKSDTHIRGQLRLLERAGAVESKDIGARAVAWWHEDRVTRPHVAPEEHTDQPDLADAADPDESVESKPITVEEAVADLDVPGSAEKQQKREEALKDLLRHLRDSGETKGSELKTLIYEHADTAYGSENSWWGNCAHPVLKELRDRGAVELVDHHNGVWAWTGEMA